MCSRALRDKAARRRDRPGRASQRWGFLGLMGLLIRLIELLIVIVPLAGVIIAGFKAVSRVRRTPERRSDGRVVGTPKRATTQPSGDTIMRTTKEHDLGDGHPPGFGIYELDVGKLSR